MHIRTRVRRPTSSELGCSLIGDRAFGEEDTEADGAKDEEGHGKPEAGGP
jgi:hypothetical protein